MSRSSSAVGSAESGGGRMVEVDATDRRLLELLRRDARASVRDLAEHLGLSRASAYARLRRLRETGVLRGFTTVVDQAALGLGLPAYVHLRVEQDSWKALKAKVVALPEAVHVALVAGDFDVTLLVRCRDADHLRELVLERIQAMPEVLGTHTVLVFEEEQLA